MKNDLHRSVPADHRAERGFTLIEVMIVVVIIAILAAIAYPSYQNQVQKTRRSDAMSALTSAAAAQERWFTENSQYTGTRSDISPEFSEEGYYRITLDNPTGGSCGATGEYCFTLTATAVGAQLGDENCRTMSITHTGAKSSTDKDAAASTGCW